ncbi:MAG TPA: hypothetical protein PK579_15420, partial [Phycisphaerae bacterium]|nr:hypothetical protein [Phycisphaerae bacterium]
MAFAGGAVTFKRFYVLGQGFPRVDEEVLKKLADHAHGADSIRTADKTELGWTTGQHILDTKFDFSKNAIADGLHFAIRVDTNKPPADLVRSYQRLAEEAMLEASGREFLTKGERKEAREQALARADQEAAAGQFRRSKAVPVFWDLKRNEVYLGAAGASLADQFMLLFRETFQRSLAPATAGEIASRWAQKAGEVRAFDDCTPAHFVTPPEGAADASLYSAEAGSRDFLGTEFLTWLWYTADTGSSEITTAQGHSIAVMFEKAMQLQCAFRMNGSVTIQADGPADQPEASVALAAGKLPLRAGIQLAVHGDVYGFSLRPDMMHFSAVVLPESKEASTPRDLFEERMDHLRDVIEAMDTLYVAFLKKRLSSKWPATLNAVRAWVARRLRQEFSRGG